MKLLFQEVQRFAGDTYATAAERRCVTSRHRLRAIGVGDPKPYGNKKRTWDSCYVKYITKARTDYISWGLDPTIDPDPEQLAPGRPPTGKEPANYWSESEDSSDSEDVDLDEDEVGEAASSSKGASSKSASSTKRHVARAVLPKRKLPDSIPSQTSESSSSSRRIIGSKSTTKAPSQHKRR